MKCQFFIHSLYQNYFHFGFLLVPVVCAVDALYFLFGNHSVAILVPAVIEFVFCCLFRQFRVSVSHERKEPEICEGN